MKIRIVLLTFIIIATYSCSTKTDSNVFITGNVKGLNKGMLYLEKLDDTILKAVDSVQIDGEPNFSLSTYLESPEVFYIFLEIDAGEIPDTRLPLFLEPGNINVKTTLNNFQTDAVITGSANQDKYQEYLKAMERYTNKNLELIKAGLEASQRNNDSLANHLKQQQDALVRSKYLATANFAKNNNNYAVAPYLILTEVSDMSIKYMDTVYNALQDSIKTSHYGKQLEALIKKRKTGN